MSDLEYKSATTSGHLITDDKTGVVEAFVSVTGIKDNVNDIIIPGAYAKTLQTRRPKGVYSHSWETPVSKALDVKEILPGQEGLPETLPDGSPWPAEAGALYVKMQFNLDTQRGREAYSDVQFYGEDAEWSIGYNVPAGASSKGEDGVRHIKELNLFEFSPVLFGAASQARTKKDALSALEIVKESKAVDSEFMAEIKTLLGELDGEAGTGGEPEGTGSADQKSEDPDVETPESTVEDGVKAAVTETANAVEVAEVPEAEAEDAGDQQEIVEEVVEDLTALESSALNGGLPAEVIDGLRKVQDILADIVNIAAKPALDQEAEAAPAAPAPVAPTEERKTMRDVLNDMIYNTSYDVDRLDTIDNGVRSLQKSIEAQNDQAILSQAESVLDEIGFAAQSTTDQNFVRALEKLSVSVGEALQEYSGGKDSAEGEAPVDGEALEATSDTSNTSTVTEGKKTLTQDEWKSLMDF